MRVVVLGSSGLLGSSLVPYLRAVGHDVLVHSRKGGAGLQAELTDARQVDAALDPVAPEVIINLAALTNVDECERNPQMAYLANVRIVENLARWIRKYGGSCHLVQISTDQVYNGPGPHREDNITLTNYYGFSKYAGELSAASVPSTVLRTNFIGPSRCPGRVSLSDWLVQSLTRGDSITVFDDVRFSPLSLQRVVQLIELVSVQRRLGVFNLGSKDGMSKADLAFALAAALDLPTRHLRRGTSDEAKLFANRPKDMCMDSSRFENAFGIQLPTLREEIQSMRGAYSHEAG